MKRRHLAMIVLAAAIVAALAVRLRPSDTKRIHKQLDRLGARFSREPGESTAVMAAKMHLFGDLFTTAFEVQLLSFAWNGMYSRAEIASHVARIRPRFRSIRLTFPDVDIRLDSPDAAVAIVTARLVVEHADGGVSEDTREVCCALKKLEDSWLFAGFYEVEVLER